MIIGAQMYTVRDFCKDLDGFAETLKKIADIGYTTVQVSGTCGYDAKWLKEQLDKNGLKCVLTHIPPDKLLNNTLEVAKNHDILDCKYVGLGWYGFNEANENDNYQSYIEKFTPVMNTLADNGKYFMHHNHDQELRKLNNQTVLEKLEREFSAEKLGFVLDTFWVQAGGGDPAYWIERFAGRVPCIHLKDFASGKIMSVLGEGNINFDRVFEKAEKAGTEYMLVEQDDCNGEDPFECLKRSYEYLKAKGFK